MLITEKLFKLRFNAFEKSHVIDLSQTPSKQTCRYFCRAVLTHIQTGEIYPLHMLLGTRRAFYHVLNQYFFQKQTHTWSVVTDESLYFSSVVSIRWVEILLGHWQLADAVEISTWMCLLYVCCLAQFRSESKAGSEVMMGNT